MLPDQSNSLKGFIKTDGFKIYFKFYDCRVILEQKQEGLETEVSSPKRLGRRSPHARSRISTLGACLAVDSPTPFTVIITAFRPHDRAVKSKGLDQLIEA